MPAREKCPAAFGVQVLRRANTRISPPQLALLVWGERGGGRGGGREGVGKREEEGKTEGGREGGDTTLLILADHPWVLILYNFEAHNIILSGFLTLARDLYPPTSL